MDWKAFAGAPLAYEHEPPITPILGVPRESLLRTVSHPPGTFQGLSTFPLPGIGWQHPPPKALSEETWAKIDGR